MRPCYVSPFRSEFRPDYSHRGEGWPPLVRKHIFPQSDGTEVACNPKHCRECYRERQCEEHHDGQK